MTRSLQRLLSAGGALVLVLSALAPPAAAQEAENPASADSRSAEDNIDEILAAEEAMLSGEVYSYDPANRRDPFKSLLATRTQSRIRGPRPDGIPGLLIDEIDLTGIFITGEGPMAQVLSADKNESFLLRQGDQLYDGDVISIAINQMVFRQVVDDPTAIKPFREIVKRLNP